MLQITPDIQKLIDSKALFVVNSSGGKDSQAMTILLRQLIPLEQLLIIHAHLPEVEWEGVKEHIEANAMGIPVHYCQSGKTFFEMVAHRGKFPSPATRQCTSDLKRAPIQKFINNYCKDNGISQVVNCMGLRAEESTNRANKATFQYKEGNSAGHREQYEWLPIHHLSIGEVWATIAGAGQVAHWAYSKGMSRLSCCFCIMASEADIKIAAHHNPELYNRISALEHDLAFTLLMPSKGKQIFLSDIVEGQKAQLSLF